MHPNTVFAGEWYLCTQFFPQVWELSDTFVVEIENLHVATRENPWSLEEIGRDIFVRFKLTKPIWFVDPWSNTVHHSGAKKNGVRFCSICQTCTSSNNFTTQHLSQESHKSQFAVCVGRMKHL